MIRIKGRYNQQKLELDQPLDLPEGTEVEVAIYTDEDKEKLGWTLLGMSRLEKEWDNPEDAVYDDLGK